MGLAGRAELILDPEVHPQLAALEPAAPAEGEMGRLGHLGMPRSPAVEGDGVGLPARRHGQLDMVDGLDAHRSGSGLRPRPPARRVTGNPENRGMAVSGSSSSLDEVSRLTLGSSQPWGTDTTPGRIASVTSTSAADDP